MKLTDFLTESHHREMSETLVNEMSPELFEDVLTKWPWLKAWAMKIADHSIKRGAAGLMVRPFNVTRDRICKSIGRAFSDKVRFSFIQ
jgi:hypothetical protein